MADQGSFAEFGVEIPFVTHLGFGLVLYEGGRSEISFEPRPEHLNSFGVAHGGACMTLLDVAMAVAARSAQKDMGVITIEMKTTFMRPSTGLLSGRGRLMHRTGSIAFVEASIVDTREQVCAHATGTFRYVRESPQDRGGAHPQNAISID